MRKIFANNLLKSVIFTFSVVTLFSACHEEEPPKINVAQNISGTWIAKKKVFSEMEAGSNWRYQEVTNEVSGEWLNIPYSFRPDGTYFIEYKEPDNHIVKYKGHYEIEEDTLKMSDVDTFPCHDAIVSLSSLTSMMFLTPDVNEAGTKVKTEIYFQKESEMRAEHALPKIKADKGITFVCSANNRSFVNNFKVQNVSDNSIQINIKKGDSADITVLTAEAPILTYNEELGMYFAKSVNDLQQGGHRAIFIYNHEDTSINTPTSNSKIDEENSIGEALFWIDED